MVVETGSCALERRLPALRTCIDGRGTNVLEALRWGHGAMWKGGGCRYQPKPNRIQCNRASRRGGEEIRNAAAAEELVWLPTSP